MNRDGDKLQKQVKEIEATQKALRDSIEETKRLAEKSDQLLNQHKRDLEDQRPFQS